MTIFREFGTVGRFCELRPKQETTAELKARSAELFRNWCNLAPELAVLELDGGRIRTRLEGQGQGTHDDAWRESKNALFQRMTSETHAEDPCPDICFFAFTIR